MSYKFSYVPQKVEKVETRYRRIVSKIPHPKTIPFIKKSLKYEPDSMNILLPLLWNKAQGFQVYDGYGNKWLDFTSGIFVANSGHGNKYIVKAIEKTITKPLLHTFLYPTEERARLAEKLVAISPKHINKVLILSTGAEVTETALKLARIWGRKQSRSKLIIVSFMGSFHGETLGSKTMSGDLEAKRWIGKTDPNIVHLPYPVDYLKSLDVEESDYGEEIFNKDIKELGKRINLKNIAGFIMEPYQGWAAMFFPKGYIRALQKFADKNKSLVMFDEVQSGFGRTGRFFAHEYYDIKADVFCCAKGISGGLPLSAVFTSRNIIDVDPAGLNSTHAGNPVVCASSLANINYMLRHNLVENAYKMGKIIESKLFEVQKIFPERIKSIHGKGLAYAAMFVKPSTDELDIDFVNEVVERAFRKGLLLIKTGKGSIKLGPPLIITKSALIEGLDIITECISDTVNKKT